MNFRKRLISFVAVAAITEDAVAFQTATRSSITTVTATLRFATNQNDGGWSVADNWDALSSENPLNSVPDSRDIFNQDIAANAASSILADNAEEDIPPQSEEDQWLDEVIEDILQNPLSSTPLYDTGIKEAKGKMSRQQQEQFEDQMGKEIAMLVRCNESPEDILIQAGRAVPKLTLAQKNDVSQLVQWNVTSQQWDATPFLSQAVRTMFKKHAASPQKGMDAKAVSHWMTQSLGKEIESYTEKDKGKDMTSMRRKKSVKITHHDSRVLKLLSKYSEYGTGRLTPQNLEQIYIDALTIHTNGKQFTENLETLHTHNADHIRQVWRDLDNHGIVGPNEFAWRQERQQLEQEYGSLHAQTQALLQQEDFVDECEILDEFYDPPPTKEQIAKGHDAKNHKYIRKSSFQQVKLASDGKTPLYMNEGDFVFIDEESCIGCMQCVTAAPASFLLLENGRARTFHQRTGPDVKQGVAACPVNCMHFVSYDELKELENVRDNGDGRDDHRHMGHRRGHTPLYVSGIDSDNNHRSSWYHYIKGKCCTSGRCPQRGCFDCPSYRASGDNPYFKEKHKKSQHVRAQHFLDHGDVDIWRKTADL